MTQILLPETLYDLEGSVMHGVIRASGHLMRVRIEYLMKQADGELGLRRAMHTCILAEVVNNAYSGPNGGPRAERLFGLFARELTQKVVDRLVASKATLRSDELHFADIRWWGQLDRERASIQLENNLLRMIGDEPTICLMLGVEMQVLLDVYMRHKWEGYPSLIAKYATPRYPFLVEARGRFAKLLELPVEA